MKIFIADYLPLANKGEEEILRGIETLFSHGAHDNICFSIFGDVENVVQVGNIVIYPQKICYPDFLLKNSTTIFSRIFVILYIFAAFFLNILGIYIYRRQLRKHPQIIEDFEQSDKIIIGHDGFFNICCAMLGQYLHQQGLHYGILGAGFNRPSKRYEWMYKYSYKKCFDNADYVILREQTAYKYVSSISQNYLIKLFPDPAFFCPNNKYNSENISHILRKYHMQNSGALRIGLTICEDSISFINAFIGYSNKTEAHRLFFTELMTTISDKYKCSFYFLPHCIKEGKGNDLEIARDIKSRLDKSIDFQIIEEDMPILDIKYLISMMDLMIGERTHSIINSISTNTPFVSLTCSADFRTHDIVGIGCDLRQQIYDLDYPDKDDVFNIIEQTICHSELLKSQMASINKQHHSLEKEIKQIIWN